MTINKGSSDFTDSGFPNFGALKVEPSSMKPILDSLNHPKIEGDTPTRPALRPLILTGSTMSLFANALKVEGFIAGSYSLSASLNAILRRINQPKLGSVGLSNFGQSVSAKLRRPTELTIEFSTAIEFGA